MSPPNRGPKSGGGRDLLAGILLVRVEWARTERRASLQSAGEVHEVWESCSGRVLLACGWSEGSSSARQCRRGWVVECACHRRQLWVDDDVDPPRWCQGGRSPADAVAGGVSSGTEGRLRRCRQLTKKTRQPSPSNFFPPPACLAASALPKHAEGGTRALTGRN